MRRLRWRNRSKVPYSPPCTANTATAMAIVKTTSRLMPGPNAVDRPAGILRRVAQLLLDPQELVVLGDTVGPAGRPGLDLAHAARDREVGDECVLGFAGAVRDDRQIPRAPGQLDGFHRPGERADLIELDQNRVGGLAVDATR